MTDNKVIKFIINFLKEIGIIILYILLIAFFSILFSNNQNKITYTLSNILIELIVLIIIIYIFRKTFIAKFNDFKKNYRSYIKSCFKYYLIGFIIMFVSLNIITIFFEGPANEAGNQELIAMYPIYSIFSTLIFAPITEELITKVYLKKGINNKVIYSFVAGLIFASLHVISEIINGNLYELLYLIPYGGLGITLSYMYAKTDNIWTNITFHSFHNFICLLLSFI